MISQRSCYDLTKILLLSYKDLAIILQRSCYDLTLLLRCNPIEKTRSERCVENAQNVALRTRRVLERVHNAFTKFIGTPSEHVPDL